MPKRGEKAKKIKQLKAGEGVRAPRKYWQKIQKEMKSEYPKVSKKRLGALTGKRWNNISTKKKIEIVKNWQK